MKACDGIAQLFGYCRYCPVSLDSRIDSNENSKALHTVDGDSQNGKLLGTRPEAARAASLLASSASRAFRAASRSRWAVEEELGGWVVEAESSNGFEAGSANGLSWEEKPVPERREKVVSRAREGPVRAQ